MPVEAPAIVNRKQGAAAELVYSGLKAARVTAHGKRSRSYTATAPWTSLGPCLSKLQPSSSRAVGRH